MIRVGKRTLTWDIIKAKNGSIKKQKSASISYHKQSKGDLQDHDHIVLYSRRTINVLEVGNDPWQVPIWCERQMHDVGLEQRSMGVRKVDGGGWEESFKKISAPMKDFKKKVGTKRRRVINKGWVIKRSDEKGLWGRGTLESFTDCHRGYNWMVT